MKKILSQMLLLVSFFVSAADAADDLWMTADPLVPVMERPGEMPKINDDGYFVYEEGRPFPEAAIVYGNVVRVTEIKDGWGVLSDIETGARFGYVPTASLSPMPAYVSDDARYITLVDAPPLRLVWEDDVHQVPLALMRGEAVVAAGRSADGTRILLRFDTHADDIEGGGGIGARYAWGDAAHFMRSDRYAPTADKIDESVFSPMMRTGDGEAVSLQDGVAADIIRSGWADAGSVTSEIYVDDMADTYAESGTYMPDFITVDVMFHAYHKAYSNYMQDIERGVLAPRLERALAAALRTLRGMEPATDDAKRGMKIAQDMISVPFYLISVSPDSTMLSEQGADEADRIVQASGGGRSAVTGAEIDYTTYLPRGHYAGDAVLERYFRAVSFLGSERLKLVDGGAPDAVSAAAAAYILCALDSAGDDWRAYESAIDILVGVPDDGRFTDFMSVMRDELGKWGASSWEAIDSAGHEQLESAARAMAAVSAPRIRDRKLDRSVPSTDVIGAEFRVSGKRYTFDARVFSELMSPSVGSDAAPRNLPAVTDVMAALGSPEANELSRAWYYVPRYEEKLQRLCVERASDIAGDTAYESWLRAISAYFDDSRAPQFFYRQPSWRIKKLVTASASFAELKHDTVLYAKQAAAEMGGGDEPFAGRFAPPMPCGYVEPDPSAFGALESAARRMREVIRDLKADVEAPEWSMYDHVQHEETRGTYDEIFEILERMNGAFKDIAEREVSGAEITPADYAQIKHMKRYLTSRIFFPAGRDVVEDREQLKMALVTDIATDNFGGRVLHAATGRPSSILVYVADRWGGSRITRGVVYSYYEFVRPISDGRMTDAEWRGLVYDEARTSELEALRPDWIKK